MTKLFEKLKEHWGLDSFWHVVLILFIFSITGMTALYIRQFFFDLFGITSDTALSIKIIAWLLVVFPSYQALFLIYGFLLGQFDFVWRFEKKSLNRIKNLFVRSE
ncbi:prolipoprotein diacylglyceryl transferase [Balneolaceae bacterium YR4-1]|uniref:Prolipoprotein diacylglyceryl transferase n=1 Tax=Halalkalibaculum roseum TaxID=2709311 RepID=A0A6M1SWI0_9BACT|nr:DUF6787 family protein [Halalkalibaculum roseum]NGP75394.1 prolipoprotein diacylglyceryl transferase [Halalkalibaculum roseum]